MGEAKTGQKATPPPPAGLKDRAHFSHVSASSGSEDFVRALVVFVTEAAKTRAQQTADALEEVPACPGSVYTYSLHCFGQGTQHGKEVVEFR